MELQNLKDLLNKYQNEYDLKENVVKEKEIALRSLALSLEENRKALTECQDNDIVYNQSKTVINDILLKTRDEALKFIEDIVTVALQEVFTNKKLKLKFQLKTDGAKTSVQAFIEEDGFLFSLDGPRGGGLKDLISIAILICVRTIVKPPIELPLLLDESFKFLHSTEQCNYRANGFKFLKTICEKLDSQIIIITGDIVPEALQVADNVLTVKTKNKQSYLE